MPQPTLRVALSLFVFGLSWTLGPNRASAAGPIGRWMGQDGKDFVGLNPKPAPSDVQDVHIALGDLPRLKLTWARIAGTGAGGGEWHSNKPGVAPIHVVRSGISPRADLYFEPHQVEKVPRDFEIQLQFESGPIVYVWVKGGRADPALRMASARLAAKWGGMTTEDHASLGPSVGPDGLLDAKIALAKLSTKDEIKSIEVRAKDGSIWRYGQNPEGSNNAELLFNPKDKSQGDLYFQPDRDLAGQSISLRVTYASGTVDSGTISAGKTVANSLVARGSTVAITPMDLKVSWLGQDGTKRHGLGDVHLTIQGVPAARTVVAAELSDPAGSSWVWKSNSSVKFPGNEGGMPLELVRGSDSTTWHAAFPPTRNESGTPMTLRLIFADGKQVYAKFNGGLANPDFRSSPPAASAASAKPGDDLESIANKHGTVRLGAGVYRLTKPLILNHPVTLTSDGGAILEFAQGPGQPAWTTAIKIHSGRTTLDQLAIRFAGPVRWDRSVGHGPAVIGTTDDRDKVERRPIFGLAFTRLNIDSPPASSAWEEAPSVIRLTNASSGRIEGCTIRGGSVEFWGGPWRIADNIYTGTPPNTDTGGVFCGHYTHDLVVSNNRAKPVGPSGKTWRFLVLTQRGWRDVVKGNVVEGIGARDDDVHPHPNAPEILLTEAYRIHFEGKPLTVSADGRVIKTPKPQGEPITAGDVLAILSGPNAGQWRSVVQSIGAGSLLLDSPLPAGTVSEAVSVVTGYVEDLFEGNTVDTRGSTIPYNLCLAGNHFGLTVRNNRLLGGGEGFKLMAPASELPLAWGWSHAPMFGVKAEGNRIEDAWNGANLGVEHSPHIKSSKGRVYWSGVFSNNTFAWSDAFATRRLQAKESGEAVGLMINYPTPFDPTEMILTESGNRREGGPSIPSAKVIGARVNGRVMSGGAYEFSGVSSAGRAASIR